MTSQTIHVKPGDSVTVIGDAAPVVTAAPPPPPPTGTVITAGTKFTPATGTTYLLRGGVHPLGWGPVERHEANVVILPYPGEVPVIDGTGLDPHFAYLGPGANGWVLGVPLRGFHPTDSGVVAVGDSCSLHTLDGFSITGAPITAKYEQNSHLLYFHGSGTGILDNPVLVNAPGAGLHSYRGSANVTVNRGRIGGRYESALLYNGSFTFNGTAFVETSAAWDIDVGDPTVVKALLTGCTGTGTGGAVRRHG